MFSKLSSSPVMATDRGAFEAHHGGARTLVQDDHVFDAVCVGMGCMGVIYAVTLEVRPAFWLMEKRTMLSPVFLG